MTNSSNRAHLNFAEEAKKAFEFLYGLGFSEVEALPTLVRLRKEGIEVDIYHGQQSYEIGVGVSLLGARYSISEIIRLSNLETAETFRNPAMTTPKGVVIALKELSALLNRFGKESLNGDPQFFSRLEAQRKEWSEEYALDVLTAQLRPQADEAFRLKDYKKAAILYSQIKKSLSPIELKKLDIAEKRSGG